MTHLGTWTTSWLKSAGPSGTIFNHRFRFEYYLNGQSISNNTSTIHTKIYCETWNANWIGDTTSLIGTSTINGTNVNRSSVPGSARGKGSQTWLVGTGDVTVTHNSNGTKTITVSGAGRVPAPPDNATIYTGSKSIVLPSIVGGPVYTGISHSSITLNSVYLSGTVNAQGLSITDGGWDISTNGGSSWSHHSGGPTGKSITGLNPGTTYWYRGYVVTSGGSSNSGWGSFTTSSIAKYTSVPNNIDVDKPFTVSFSRNGASTVELGIYKGGSVTMAAYRTVSGSSYTFNLTQAEKNAFYNDMSGDKTNTYEVFIATNSNAYRESHTRTFEIKDADPTFSGFTWKPTDVGTPVLTGWSSDISTDNNKTIQGKTVYNITCTPATAKKGATISRYEASINNIVVSSSTPNITLSAPVSGDGNLVVKAIDSRGNYGSITKAIKTIPYTNPSFTSSPTFTRRGYPNGHLLNVVIKAKVAKLMYETSYWGVSYLFRPRIQGAVWSEEFSLDSSSTIDSDGYITFSGQLSQSFNTDYAYDFQIFISDYYIDVPVNGNATSDTPLLSKRKGRIGINKVAQEGYSLDVGGGVNIDKFLQFSEAMTSNDKGMIFKKTGSGFDFLRIVDGEMYLNNKRVAKISYGTSAPPTLEDGEIYFRY